MGRHHTELRKYRVFALLLDDQCFVGKTRALRMSAVYSDHRRGRLLSTRGVMDQETPPALHILESLECTGAEAYRHVLAWLHLLEGAGYTGLNHGGTLEASDDLRPQTEAIYQSLSKEPVHEILTRTRLEKPSDGNLKPEKTGVFPKKPEKNVQMNLWLPPQDKRDFRQFCKKHRLRSRDALGLLLDQAAGNDIHLRQIQTEYQKELAALRRELRKRLSTAAQERAADFLAFLEPGLGNYLRRIFPSGEALPSMPYKRFRRKNPNIRLSYPEEGFLLLDAHCILWGRNRAKFLVGRGENGENLQLRYYQHPLYACLEVTTAGLWYIGCRKASDGAMEIVVAFPVPPMAEIPKDESEPPARKPGLDDLIRGAQSRNIP